MRMNVKRWPWMSILIAIDGVLIATIFAIPLYYVMPYYWQDWQRGVYFSYPFWADTVMIFGAVLLAGIVSFLCFYVAYKVRNEA